MDQRIRRSTAIPTSVCIPVALIRFSEIKPRDSTIETTHPAALSDRDVLGLPDLVTERDVDGLLVVLEGLIGDARFTEFFTIERVGDCFLFNAFLITRCPATNFEDGNYTNRCNLHGWDGWDHLCSTEY
jgi:hypothetical protein